MKLKMLSSYKLWQKYAIFCLMFIILSTNIIVALNSSPFWDERCYIGTGKYALDTGNMEYDAFAYQPPLSYYLNSIFLIPLDFDAAYKSDSCWFNGNDMIFNSGYDPSLIIFLSRLPFIIISMIFSVLVLKFAQELYGPKSGLMALSLYALSTSILSYSNVSLTDFLVSFFIFTTIYSFRRLISGQSLKFLILTGLSFGLAQLSKASALVLIPCLIALGIMHLYFRGNREKKPMLRLWKNLLLIFIIGFVVLWAGYGFQLNTLKEIMPSHYADRAYEELGKLSPLDGAAKFMLESIPVPAPSYLFSLGFVSFYSRQGHGNFFLGEISPASKPHFPIMVFLLKSQTALLILIAALILLHRKLNLLRRPENYYLIIPILMIFAFFMLAKNTAGIRHILPVYPLLFVFASQIAMLRVAPGKTRKYFNIFLISAVAYYSLSFIAVFPYPMSYFNVFGGGTANGYKLLVGTNLDSGQSLPQLREFMESNKIEKINLSYFGSVEPADYGVRYDYMPSPYFQPWVPDYEQYSTIVQRKEDCSKRKGFVAVSVTNLQNVHLVNKTCFDWLKDYEPIGRPGNSIFVYNID